MRNNTIILGALAAALSVAAIADEPVKSATCSQAKLNQQKTVTVKEVPRTALCLQTLGDEQPIWVLMDDSHPLYINERALKAKGDDILEDIESKTQQMLQSENVQQLLDRYKALIQDMLKSRDDTPEKPQTI